MIFGSVCSGIEAASVAWHPLGWRAAWLAEIEPFPSAVLAHHYPETPNHGDFTRLLRERPATVDVLVGGTPCQSFSVAGLRGGLTDHRGNLALAFMALVDVLRPRWVVWENVPGVLSSNGGRDFGSILGALGQLGYGFAYRVLDAQYFGLAQRRKRVFVVGHLGDWRRAAAVLFEPEGVRRDSPPRRETGARTAGSLGTGATSGGGWRVGADEAAAGHVLPVRLRDADGETVRTLNAHPTQMDLDTETFIDHTLRGTGHDASEDGTVSTVWTAELMPTLSRQMGGPSSQDMEYHCSVVQRPMGVRRLTPREMERLQGFPDDYTAIPWRGKGAENCPDGPRAKALGNSMAVPVMRWIGERIATVENVR